MRIFTATTIYAILIIGVNGIFGFQFALLLVLVGISSEIAHLRDEIKKKII